MCLLLIFSSCTKEDEIKKSIPMSYYENTICFQLQDNKGNDLLNTSTPGHYKISDIKITNRPSWAEPTTLVPKTSVYVEIHKHTEDNYYYIQLGLIMPKNVGEEEYIEVETNNKKEMAWVSETAPTYTKLKIGNEPIKTFKAIYKTSILDIPNMDGNGSTIAQNIWCNNKLIYDVKAKWQAPIIKVTSK